MGLGVGLGEEGAVKAAAAADLLESYRSRIVGLRLGGSHLGDY